MFAPGMLGPWPLYPDPTELLINENGRTYFACKTVSYDLLAAAFIAFRTLSPRRGIMVRCALFFSIILPSESIMAGFNMSPTSGS